MPRIIIAMAQQGSATGHQRPPPVPRPAPDKASASGMLMRLSVPQGHRGSPFIARTGIHAFGPVNEAQAEAGLA